MKNKILTIAIALLIGGSAFGQRLVDPAKNYYYNFDNDCAIKAVSAVLNISYKESYILLKDIYIENVGVTIRDLFRFTYNRFPNSDIFAVKGLVPSEFIKAFKEPSESYLVIAKNHVFYMENNSVRGWEMVGIESDFNRRIIMAIKLKK